MTSTTCRIEAVTGELPEADRAVLEALAATPGAAELRAARLPQDLVCVVRDVDGALVGASTARPADVELVGGQRFGVYAAALSPEVQDAADALLSGTFAALDAAHDGAPDAPIGLCVLIADSAEMERRPEVQWADPPAFYVGYLDDARQVRIAYYEGALLRDPDARG